MSIDAQLTLKSGSKVYVRFEDRVALNDLKLRVEQRSGYLEEYVGQDGTSLYFRPGEVDVINVPGESV